MKIKIQGRNFNPNERLTEIIESKLSKLDKYFDDDVTAKVCCYATGGGEKYVMEVTIKLGKKILRAEETTDNIYENIDLIMPKLTRQIRKYRTKLDKKVKKEALKSHIVNEDFDEKTNEIVKRKTFNLTPMSLEEAEQAFEMIDHDFYVFILKDTGMVNVLYKRVEGDYGLIDLVY